MQHAIRHLDHRFESLAPLLRQKRPVAGWLRAVRKALGMTTSQFAKRLGVSQPRIVELEKSELSGAVTLATLERAAQALGCRLIYALVPERPLEDMVRERAETLAQKQLRDVEQTMALEDQSVSDVKARRRLLQERVDALLERPKRLWDAE